MPQLHPLFFQPNSLQRIQRDSFNFRVGLAPSLVLMSGVQRPWFGTPQQLARHPHADELLPDWVLNHIVIEESEPERDDKLSFGLSPYPETKWELKTKLA